MDIEERAGKWFGTEHGDHEGPFCKEEMLAAYLAGSAQTQADYAGYCACDCANCSGCTA
jgi:hypothetical protein